MPAPNEHLSDATRYAADTPLSALVAMFDLSPDIIAAAHREGNRKYAGPITDDDRAMEAPAYWLARFGSPWHRRPVTWDDAQDGTIVGVDGIPRASFVATTEEEFARLVNTLQVYAPSRLLWPTELVIGWMKPPVTIYSIEHGDRAPSHVGPGYRVKHTQDQISCWRAFLRVLAGRIAAEDAIRAYRHVRAASGVRLAHDGY